MKLNTRKKQSDKIVKLTYETYKFSIFQQLTVPMINTNEFFSFLHT